MTKLEKLLEVLNDEHIYIQPHNYPDQDALASAYGLKYMLENKGYEVSICYKGQIDKMNTVAMVDMLEIETVLIDDAVDMDEQSKIIVIDAQKGNINVDDFIGDEVACIDHHKVIDTDAYGFFDIRTDVGACSSIIASYFVENDIEIPEKIATALLYGIKMDTNNLTRKVSDLDIDMFYHLFKRADRDYIRMFESRSLQMADLRAYATAITNLKVFGNIGLVDIGHNCTEAILGTMSDFIMSLQEVTFAVVYSRRAGGIKFSVRSEDERLDAAHIIRRALDGVGSGGGHATMAAGFVPDVETEEDADKVVKLVEQRIVERVERIFL